jgi:hypothetical protein
MKGRPSLHIASADGRVVETRRTYDELVGLLNNATEIITRQRQIIEALKLGIAEKDAEIRDLEAVIEEIR